MSAVIHNLTARDLLELPSDGFRYELVKGELRKMAPAGHEHGRVGFQFALELGQFVKQHNLGVLYLAETGFLIARGPDTVRAPDVAFVKQSRLSSLKKSEGYFPGPPDLAVEVVSPSDTYTDVEEKAFSWLDAGSLLVLVIIPSQRTVTVFRSRTEIAKLVASDVLAFDDVVPGFSIAVSDIFG